MMCEIDFILLDGGEGLKVSPACAVELSSLSVITHTLEAQSERGECTHSALSRNTGMCLCTWPKHFQSIVAETTNEPHLLTEASLGETENVEAGTLELTSLLSSIN